MPKPRLVVTVAHDDIDRHHAGCRCGDCNSQGISYGMAIYDVLGELLLREHGPSEPAVEERVVVTCREFGWSIRPLFASKEAP